MSASKRMTYVGVFFALLFTGAMVYDYITGAQWLEAVTRVFFALLGSQA